MAAKVEIFDGRGAHNFDLVKSAGRVIEGATFKKQRVIGLIPTLGMVPVKVALAMRHLAFAPNQASIWMAADGMEVGEAYSSAIDYILSHPELKTWEYILTMEHDNLPPADGVLRLVKRMDENKHLAAIGGIYWTKGPGGAPQIWGNPRDPASGFAPQPPDPSGGLVECRGTGMGFTLFRIKMFADKNLRRPWFATKDGCTQDLYFWNDAQKNGYRCAIDCSVKVGHLDYAGAFGPAGKVW